MNIRRDKIRRFRKEKDWTLEQLGEKIGVSGSYVSLWENPNNREGEEREPSLECIEKMMKLFDCTFSDLVDIEGRLDHPRSDCEKLCDGFSEFDKAVVRVYKGLGKNERRKVQEFLDNLGEQFQPREKSA